MLWAAMRLNELFCYFAKVLRAGLVKGKCLISKWDSEETVVQVPLILNQLVLVKVQ